MSQTKENVVVEEKATTTQTTSHAIDEEVKEEVGDVVTPDVSTKDWLMSGSSWGMSMMNKAYATTIKKTYQTLDSVKADFNELSEEISKTVSTTTDIITKKVETVSKMIDEQLTEEPLPEDNANQEEPKTPEPFTLLPQVNFGGLFTKIADTVKNFALEDTTAGEDEFVKEVTPHALGLAYKLDPIHFSSQLKDGKIFMQGMDNEFETFSMSFVLEGKEDEIRGILSQLPDIHDKLDRLVPSIMDELGFWMRYYYQVEKLKLLNPKQVLSKKESTEGESEAEVLNFGGESKVEETGDESWSVCSGSSPQ
uniref:BSD domain-containing protein n=1 Tax=Rhabditophanes sp. KR3021 TaxID=114890 RepID=A0AC35TWS5_9BILA